ncbi:hypothetical protein D3C71_1222950 [compost metagenome]
MHIDRGICAFTLHSPDFVHELDTGEDAVRIRQQLVQQVEFFLREGLLFLAARDRQGIIIQHQIAYN